MQYRILGRTGLKVSTFSLGSWITFYELLSQAQVNSLMSFAIESGINFFDTAELYGQGEAESVMGKALKILNHPRDHYLICSKVFWGGPQYTQLGLHRKHIIEGCERSLKRLQLDYLDIYLCHRPDPNTSVEETVIAMNLLINQGKILYWGTSEWPEALLLEAYYCAKQMHMIGPSVEQFEYNLFCRHKAEVVIPALNEKLGLGSMITMPLARGLLTGRYNQTIEHTNRALLQSHTDFRDELNSAQGQEKIEKVKKLSIIAEQIGCSMTQLSLAWCFLNQSVHTVILGTSTMQQLKENLSSLDVVNRLQNDTALISAIEDCIANKPPMAFQPSYAQVVALS